MKRVLKAFAFAAAIVVALVSCKKEDQPKEVALTGIELNATTQTLQVGQEFQLTVTYKPENATSKPAATWASDAPAVATVDGGKVVAVAAGTAKITATVGTFTAECAITVASAEEEILPVEGNSAWSVIGALLGKSWDTDFVCAEENGAFVLKNVKLAKGNEIKFRKDKAWDVNRGINEVDKSAELAAGTPTKAIQGGGNIIIPADGIYDLYYFAEKEAIVYVAKDATLPEIPDFTENTQPEGLVMDGDASDWAELNPDYLVNLELPSDAEKTGIKSAKAYYDDKLYLLVELSDDALADSKARLHVYFDVDNSGLLKQNGWTNSTIDYVTEGKVHENGAFVAYGSTLYATLQESWACTDTGFSPAYESAGAGNLYELSMDFEGAPAALPEAFNFGVDVVYSDWSCHGFLPVAEKLARIVKVGATDPGEVVEYVHDYTPSAEYLADSNLWKAVDTAGPDIYFYHCSGGADNWDGTDTHVTSMADVPFATFEQSTYALSYEGMTNSQWMNQFFLFPKAENAIPVAAGDKLKFKATVYSDQAHPHAFFKLVTYNSDKPDKPEGGVLWEFGYQPIAAGEPLVIENAEIVVADGVSAENVVLVFDFGGNPENNKIYIKDIILEKVVPETPAELGPFDSNVEWAASTDDKAYTDNVLNVTYDGSAYENVANVKLGTSSKVGKFTLTIPAGTTYVTYWAIGWNGKDGVYKITAGENVIDGKAIANTGAANTSPYSVTVTDADKYMINLGGALPADLPVTIETTSDGYRAFFFGIQAHSDAAPNPPAPAANITLDGNFDDWADIEAQAKFSAIPEWKYAFTQDNLCLYLKIKSPDGIREKNGDYGWRRYMAFQIDTDNDNTTGFAPGYAGMKITGCEAFGVFYPFRGTLPEGQSIPAGLEFPNGVDSQGSVGLCVDGVTDPAKLTEKSNCTVYGKLIEDYVYLEAAIPLAAIGNPASSQMRLQLSWSWDLNGDEGVVISK